MSFSSPYFTLPRFRYLRPGTLGEALSTLKEYGEDARVMAGGVGLVNLLKERLMDPKVVVDLKGISELHRLSFSEEGGLVVGATVTLNELLENSTVSGRYPALWEAVSMLSDHNLRNRSTLVGDLCEASPWVDSPPPLAAYGASVNIVGQGKERTVPVESFIKGMTQLDLAPDEIVKSVTLPSPPAGARGRYYKFARGSEFGLVNIALVASGLDKPSKRSVRLVYGGISEAPVVAVGVSEAFERDEQPARLLESAIKWVRDSVQPMSDNLASAEYRKHLVEVMTAHALRELFGRD